MARSRKDMTVKEAAELMGTTEEFIRLGLQQRVLPFGVAVKFKRWAYYINPKQFEEYTGIKRKEAV